MASDANLLTTIAQLRAHGDELTDRVLAILLRDPFWEARYGERARRFGRQDGQFHIDYLCEALATRMPSVLERYAVWLRSVLTARGMCSRHLADNFRLLADEIRASIIGSEAAVDYLRRAEAALRYEDGPAAALQADAAALLEAVTARVGAERRDELDHYLSYLADALAVGDAGRFGAYVAWRRELGPAPHDPLLPLLAAQLEARHPEAARMVQATLAAPRQTSGAQGAS